MSFANNTVIGDGCVLRLPLPYLADEYVRRWSSCSDSCRFAILVEGPMLTVVVGCSESETALAGSRRRWRNLGGRCALDDHTHGSFMNMPYVCSVEEVS